MTGRRLLSASRRRLVALLHSLVGLVHRIGGVVHHPVTTWRRWSLTRRVGAIVAVVVTLWAALMVIDLYRIQRDLRAGRAGLTNLTADRVDAAGGIGPLADRADRHLQAADRLAHSSFALAPLAFMPAVRGQVHGLRDITGATAKLGSAARHEADLLQSSLDKGASADRRVALVDKLVLAVDHLQHRIATIHIGAGGFLMPPLSGARSQLVHELDKVHRKLGDSGKSLAAFRTFLATDHRVLILGANNAEMRGGNGMPLSAGVARIHDGQIEVGSFVPTSDLWNPTGPISGLPPDLVKTYGWNTGGFAVGQEWRETNVTPNFVETAPIFARMAERQGLGHVDGVIMVDALALRALFEATGPITLGDRSYDASNVIQEVLNENYKRFGNRSAENRSARLDLQSELAKAVFQQFNTRPVSATKLASALLAVTPGRHILAWSADPTVQAAWKRLGISGGMEPDAMLVSVENISANKLDYYLTPYVGLDVKRSDDGDWLVTTAVAIYNLPRTGTSAQIEGGTSDVRPRDHRTYLDIHLPGDAYSAQMLAPSAAAKLWNEVLLGGQKDPFPHNKMLQPGFTVAGLDPPNTVVGTRYTVPYGTSRTVVIQYHLPAVDNHIVVLPSGRLNAQIWGFGKDRWRDDKRFTITW